MKKVGICLIIFVLFSQCRKDFLDRKPLSEGGEATFYNTEENAIKAINACYSTLQGPEFYGDNYLKVFECASDDVTPGKPNGQGGDRVRIDNFDVSSTMSDGRGSMFRSLWTKYYEGIQRCNTAIDRIPSIVFSDNTRKQQALGEAMFLRAFYNFHLLFTFGEAPLFNKAPSNLDDLYKPKATESEIYDFIVKDLEMAINPDYKLPATWTSDSDKGRVRLSAVYALLGKVYLFRGDYAKANKYFEYIVSNKAALNVGLLGTDFAGLSYKNNFSKQFENNDESLFEIQYTERVGSNTNGYYTDGGNAGEGTSRNLVYGLEKVGGYQELIATKDLFNEFEPNDPRLKETLFLVGDTTLTFLDNNAEIKIKGGYRDTYAKTVKDGVTSEVGTYFHIKKGVPGYIDNSQFRGTNGSENLRLIRYSDILLLYAETLAETGNLILAVDQLNKVRQRARAGNNSILPDFPYKSKFGGNSVPLKANAAGVVTDSKVLFSGIDVDFQNSKEDFLKALVHERRVELAIENHRYLDIKRWAKINGHPGNAKTIFDSKDQIPNKALAEDKKGNFNPIIHQRFPIPQYEIDKSKVTLTQNPGY